MTPEEARRAAGECADCRHAHRLVTARAHHYWRCLRAATDVRFPRFPRLPVRACPGYEPAPPAGPDPAAR
jgi:hypothetical protein